MDKAELLKKVQVLANSGVAGERENAQKMLEKLMKKYNISEIELSTEKINQYEVKWSNNNERDLKIQIFYSIVGDIDDNKGFYRRYKNKNSYVKCTSSEFLEFEAKCSFYGHWLKIELKRYYRAFINRNNIFPPAHLLKQNNDKSDELTEEDIKMLKLASNIDKHNFVKQIEGTKI